MEYSGVISSLENWPGMGSEVLRIRTLVADEPQASLNADIPRREIAIADMNSSMTSTEMT